MSQISNLNLSCFPWKKLNVYSIKKQSGTHPRAMRHSKSAFTLAEHKNLFVIIIIKSHNRNWVGVPLLSGAPPCFSPPLGDWYDIYKIAFISNHVNANRNMKRHRHLCTFPLKVGWVSLYARSSLSFLRKRVNSLHTYAHEIETEVWLRCDSLFFVQEMHFGRVFPFSVNLAPSPAYCHKYLAPLKLFSFYFPTFSPPFYFFHFEWNERRQVLCLFVGCLRAWNVWVGK